MPMDLQGLIMSNCSGPCAPGYLCPTGSSRATQEVCGNTSVYCPVGSYVPTPVSVGYYTIGECEFMQQAVCVCGSGRFLRCAGGTNESTRYDQVICPPGHYCDFGVMIDCPPGRYGATSGLSSPDCTGPCSAGYYCPTASTSPTQVCPCPACGCYALS